MPLLGQDSRELTGRNWLEIGEQEMQRVLETGIKLGSL